MASLNSIRSSFINYFKSLDHKLIDSSPLVPRNDPTLMFTNSGMVQFKNIFTGVEPSEIKRAVTSQKCVRAGGKHNDLDNVGYTARHHTFFEMLGNFSFGDYFKEQAIPFAWDLLTKEFGIDKGRLLVTVFNEDDEAAMIWKKYANLPDDRIIRIKSADNFWSMGPTGPCGPCSEIFFDHGPSLWGGPPGSKDEDGDRFIEIWNLVFMQFEQFEDGSRKTLPTPSIDTGMGLERIGALLQGQHDNYETDTMRRLIEASASATGVEPDGPGNVHHRVISDHLRSSSFLIAEGVLPSNEGRGYVLRRIMRRAMRHIHLLGKDETVMHRLVPILVQEMGQAFPELGESKKIIEDTLFLEEKRFKETLERGLKLLDGELKKLPENGVLSGEIAFKLYDTYGFPLDLTQDALREKGYTLDVKSFEVAMSTQKEKARRSWVGSGEIKDDAIWLEIASSYLPTEFLGYEAEEASGNILAIVKDGVNINGASEGQEVQIIFNQTPFFGESGGQVSDTGWLTSNTGKGSVLNVQKKGDFYVHYVRITEGKLLSDVGADLKVDKTRRYAICRNHSATHLMHEALRAELGDHVNQRGSLNDFNRLRFDFNHSYPLSRDELCAVESIVNYQIRQNSAVNTRIMTPSEAKAMGARALFGEKYGEEVRVVSMGLKKKLAGMEESPTFSIELCGGTHVKNTGEIGFFKIVSEAGLASGVRRVEAVTGVEAIDFVSRQEKILSNLSELLKVGTDNVENRVERILTEKKELQAELESVKTAMALGSSISKLDKLETKEISGVSFFSQIVTQMDSKALKGIVDERKKQLQSGVVLVISTSEEKVTIVAGVTSDLTNHISAISLVDEASKATGGNGGGGRPDLAQAGGLDPSKAEIAIKNVESLIRKTAC
ncbi:MAG: alanine--tRNA ligase [Pseudomonadota bacterium]|nr:alanine--tRNA ligase [Pseudomonadota bacterium]